MPTIETFWPLLLGLIVVFLQCANLILGVYMNRPFGMHCVNCFIPCARSIFLFQMMSVSSQRTMLLGKHTRVYWHNCVIQWTPSGKAKEVSLKLHNLVHFHAPFFTNHVSFTSHDRPPFWVPLYAITWNKMETSLCWLEGWTHNKPLSFVILKVLFFNISLKT